jgi:hypothetical protein
MVDFTRIYLETLRKTKKASVKKPVYQIEVQIGHIRNPKEDCQPLCLGVPDSGDGSLYCRGKLFINYASGL